MNAIHSDQREIRSGAIGAAATRGVRCYVSLPAHGERGVEYSSPSCFDAVTSINWPGRFANRRSGLFPHSRVARAFSRSVEPRRRAGTTPLSYRLVATFICRCRLARGPRFCLSKHSTRQSSNASEGHRSTSLVGVTFQRSERDTAQRTKSWKLQPTRTAP